MNVGYRLFVSFLNCILVFLEAQIVNTVSEPKTQAPDITGTEKQKVLRWGVCIPTKIYPRKLCMSSDKHKDNLFFGSLWEIPVFLNQCFLLYIISHYFHIVPTLRNTKISFFLFPYGLHLLLQPYWFLRLRFTEHAPFVITVHLYSSFNCILIIWLWNMN